MAYYIGRLDVFDSSTEDWNTYVERLEQFFAANEVAADKYVPVLLSAMGGKAYSLLRNLTAPNKPADKTYDDIVEVMRAHLSPKPLLIAERYRFHKRNQAKEETVVAYVAELKRLSEHCQFGTGLDDALRDRLVCGIRHEGIQKRLLTEVDLTFKRALEISVSMETAAKDALELQVSVKTENVNQLAMKEATQRQSQQCYRCGGYHLSSQCRFRNEQCRKCGKTGHIQRVCRSDKAKTDTKDNRGGNRRVHNVAEISDSESEDALASLQLHSIHGRDKQMIWLTPKINGQVIKMELDTGSAVSVISKKDYETLFAKTKLKPTSVLLKTYTGEKVVPVGVQSVQVEYNGQKEVLDLYVLERGSAPLWGREWLRKLRLDWSALKSLHVLSKAPQSTEARLDQVLEEAAPVFKEGIGTLRHIKGKITLKDGAQATFHKARPVPYAIRPVVEKELDRLEADGILSRVDWSPWATPVVPVVKKNGTVRLCGDFKVTINPVLRAEQYPLPRIEDIFAKLSGGQRFSKVDLAEAYLQMEMEEDSKIFLTINTIKGLYRYNRLVFGVASAPAIWQRAMDQVLQGVPGTQCYLDDIIVTGATDTEHLENLRRVLKRLEDYGLRARRDKCEFLKSSVTYCGHTIDANGLHKCHEKVQAVLKAPRPQDVSQLRSFLGFVNYYHRFLPNLAMVLHPLNELLQAGRKWVWTRDCEQAFKEAKKLVTSDTVLTHYNPSLPVRLACDASPYGIGAVMSHIMDDCSERPIAFASRSLTKAEKNYAQIDKEALSLVWGVKRFNQYLFGREFTLITDHQPLMSIFSPQKGVPMTAAARMQRWALFLGGHQYKIEFRRTGDHANADGLSRLPVEDINNKQDDCNAVDMFTFSQIESPPVTAEMVQAETRRDKALSQVYAATQAGWTAVHKTTLAPFYQRRNELTLQAGCVMWGVRVIIPSSLRKQILEELHSGHLGVVKMKALARSFMWWPGIDQDVERVAMQCPGCQQVQNEPARAPLHQWEWPASPWQRIHVDFAGPFMGTNFLVVVDACSKWPEVFTMTSTTTSQTITVLRDLFARTGVPEQLVSDNGPQFTSEDFQTFLRRNGIRHITSAPWHPATNGQAERFVQTLKQALRATQNDNITLHHKLSNFLFAYRNATHATTNQTPAMLFLGRHLRSRLDLLQPNSRRTVQDRQLQQAQRACEGKLRHFAIGQSVLARSYRGDHKWVRAIVKERHGPLSYTVEVASGVIWRRHVDQLKKSGLTPDEDLSMVSTAAETGRPATPPEPSPSMDCQSTCDVRLSVVPASPNPSVPMGNQADAPIDERRYPTRVHKPPQRLIAE